MEAGADKTDHIHHEPSRVSLTCLISNTPAKLGVQLRADYDPARHITAWQELVEAKESDTPLTLVTSLRPYTNMLVTSLTAVRDRVSTEVLRFSVTLERWETAFTSLIEATVADEIADMAEATAVAAANATTAAEASEAAAALEAIAA